MDFQYLIENFEITGLYTEVARWIFVILAAYILLRSIKSLLGSKNPAEVWAYMQIKTYKMDEEGQIDDIYEESMPITHWENVIGRAKSCDISTIDPAMS